MTDESPAMLVDTSASIPLLIPTHASHDAVVEKIGDLGLGLAGHALFETYSVLTRLPAPSRCSPSAARQLIEANFPLSRFLEPAAMAGVLADLTAHGIAGGATYDGLVAAAASAYSLPLATRDLRAARTYEALGVDVRYLALGS